MDDYASPEDPIDDSGVYWDVEAGTWCFPLWAEHWPSFQFYLRIQTQWRCDMNGRTGLDYNVLFHELDRASLAPDDYDEMLESMRVIERAILDLK